MNLSAPNLVDNVNSPSHFTDLNFSENWIFYIVNFEKIF